MWKYLQKGPLCTWSLKCWETGWPVGVGCLKKLPREMRENCENHLFATHVCHTCAPRTCTHTHTHMDLWPVSISMREPRSQTAPGQAPPQQLLRLWLVCLHLLLSLGFQPHFLCVCFILSGLDFLAQLLSPSLSTVCCSVHLLVPSSAFWTSLHLPCPCQTSAQPHPTSFRSPLPPGTLFWPRVDLWKLGCKERDGKEKSF